MACERNTQDSNATGLRIAEEECPSILPATPVWKQYEPNSYGDFGGTYTKVARNPINDSRQRSKGELTDLDSGGSFVSDLTANLQDIFQGLMFADLRRKGEEVVLDVDGTTEEFEVADTAGYFVGSLVFASGLDESVNDGLHRVTAITADVSATGVLTAAANPADGSTVTVGTTVYTFESGTIDAAYEVLIGATASDSLDNLIAAVNGAAGEGTLYGTGTEANPDATAAAGAGDTVDFTAIASGTAGNSVATTEVSGQLSFAAATLLGGTNGLIEVASDLTTETPTGDNPTLVVVGFQFDTADVDIDVSGSLPAMQSVAKDLTELGLIPGEPVFIGGDTTITQFAQAADLGFKRVRSIDTNEIVFDKSDEAMVTDAGAGKTIQVFFGRVLKNEAASLIVRRTYQPERTAGAPDADAPELVQAEYLPGSLLNTTAFRFPRADKATAELTFLSLDHEPTEASEGLKAGDRPDLAEQDAFNTSSDFTRLKIAKVVVGDEAPAPLFAFITEMTINVSNNASVNKAVGTLGGIDITAGQFTVGGSIEAYFADMASIKAIKENSDVTIDAALVKNNTGICFDMPLVALGDGRLNVAQDQPILVPLDAEAARGRTVHPDLDHTFLMSFFDYLPTLADE